MWVSVRERLEYGENGKMRAFWQQIVTTFVKMNDFGGYFSDCT